jgi:mono/diheme cytochrome c family protein
LVFYFTNTAVQVQTMQVTNITKVTRSSATGAPSHLGMLLMASARSVTNIVWVTNSTLLPVTIGTVHPSCGCTTAQLPPLPWTLLPGTNGQIGVTVNLAGKFGTIVKTVHIGTDRGSRDLIVQITILPEENKPLTDAERARQMAIAKVDRQAVFKNDCATCHMNRGQYKYGKELYDADCGICHEAEHRASMVPDLHSLKVTTNQDFWRTWIAQGKAGSFMPAFSTTEGGPLSDMQIASLAAYLNSAIPSKVPPPQ